MKKRLFTVFMILFLMFCMIFPSFGEFSVTYGSIEGNNVLRGQTIAIAEVKNEGDIDKIMEGRVPTVVILHIDSSLNVTAGAKGKALTDVDAVLKKLDLKIIPCFYMSDKKTADAIGDYIETNRLRDCYLMSSDPDLVKTAREYYSAAGVIDYRKASKKELEKLNVRNTTNSNLAKVALLPEDYPYEDIDWLQKRIIKVWTVSDGTDVSLYDRIISGADGVLCADEEKFYDTIAKFETDTLLRDPVIIGHRGQPATNHENTLSSAIAAYEAGADAIECDVYFSKDKEIVIMHDSDISRTTDGTGEISRYTVEELKKFKMDTNPSFEDDTIPTLREYFEYFKDKEIIQVIEIKDGNAKIVDALKELIDEYNMSSKVNFISFNANQMKLTRKKMPEISSGLLVSVNAAPDLSKYGTKTTMFNQLGPSNLSYHPSVGAMTDEFINWTRARSIPVYAWTIDDSATYARGYLNFDSVTTNYTLRTSNVARNIEIRDISTLRSDGEGNFTVEGVMITRKGEEKQVICNCVPLSDSSLYTVSKDGKVEPAAEEEVYFVPYYRFGLNEDEKKEIVSFTMYAKPFSPNAKAVEEKSVKFDRKKLVVLLVAAVLLCAAFLSAYFVMRKRRKKKVE